MSLCIRSNDERTHIHTLTSIYKTSEAKHPTHIQHTHTLPFIFWVRYHRKRVSGRSSSAVWRRRCCMFACFGRLYRLAVARECYRSQWGGQSGADKRTKYLGNLIAHAAEWLAGCVCGFRDFIAHTNSLANCTPTHKHESVHGGFQSALVFTNYWFSLGGRCVRRRCCC